MSNSKLVNRIRFTTSIKKELYQSLDQLADATQIPKSKLMDQAIEDLLRKYEEKGG